MPQQVNVVAQREAMKKLEFLAGKWQGEALVSRGPGAPLKLTQTEDVQYKLGGLVMTVEGTGRNADGVVEFQAFATITFDDAKGQYRFRAHNEGRILDTELEVTSNGFAWGYTAGPLKVRNTMKGTAKGEWAETTESVYNNGPARKSVDMLLKKLQ